MANKATLCKIVNELMNMEAVKENRYFADILTSIKTRLEDSSFNLAVVGEFSSGKSTFINALIGKDLLKHAVSETTATITYLCNVSKTDSRIGTCVITYNDGQTEILDNLNQLKDYTTAQSEKKVSSSIKNVKIYGNFLDSNNVFTITDTPGLNGIADNHRELTINAIRKAHACVYILQLKGFTASDIEFIKYLASFQRQFVFVQNFADELKEYENETPENKIDEAIKILKDAFPDYSKIHYDLCCVSSLKAVAARDKNIKTLYNGDTHELTESDRKRLFVESSFDSFEKILKDIIETGKYKQIIIESAEHALFETVSEIIEYLDKQNNLNKKLLMSDKGQTAVDIARERLKRIDERYDENRRKLERFIESESVEKQKILTRDIKENIELVYNNICDKISKDIKTYDDWELITLKHKNVGQYYSSLVTNEINNYAKTLHETENACFNNIYMDSLRRASRYTSVTLKSDIKITGAYYVAQELNKLSGNGKRMKLEMDKKELIRNKQIKNSVKAEIQYMAKGISETKDILSSKTVSYDRAIIETNSKIKALGKCPDVEKYTEPRTVYVKRSGIFGGIANLFCGDKEETRYDTIENDTKLRKWKSDYQKLSNELNSKISEKSTVLGSLNRLKNEYENKLEAGNITLENASRRIQSLTNKITSEEANLKAYESFARQEFVESEVRRLKQYFNEKLLGSDIENVNNNEPSTVYDLINTISKNSDRELPVIKKRVINKFDEGIKQIKYNTQAIIDGKNKQLEEKYKICEYDLVRLKDIKKYFGGNIL